MGLSLVHRPLQEMSEPGPGLRAQKWERVLITPSQASPVAFYLLKMQMKTGREL